MRAGRQTYLALIELETLTLANETLVDKVIKTSVVIPKATDKKTARDSVAINDTIKILSHIWNSSYKPAPRV